MFAIAGNHCVCCGYGGSDKLRVLELHHIDPTQKEFDLSVSGITSKSWDRILKELKKCIPVCPTCHREIHLGLR